jgi:hypothetical protein
MIKVVFHCSLKQFTDAKALLIHYDKVNELKLPLILYKRIFISMQDYSKGARGLSV